MECLETNYVNLFVVVGINTVVKVGTRASERNVAFLLLVSFLPRETTSGGLEPKDGMDSKQDEVKYLYIG